MKLKELDKIVEDLSKKTYSPNLELDKADEFIIDLVIPVAENNNIVENIAYIENYTPE